MATVTKISKPKAEYQEWQASGLNAGDIIDVLGSLGGRPARSVMIKGGAGDSFVRFNVVEKVYTNQGYDNSFLANAAYWRKPAQVTEFINPHKSHVRIEANTTYSWDVGEISVEDIEITVQSGVSVWVS